MSSKPSDDANFDRHRQRTVSEGVCDELIPEVAADARPAAIDHVQLAAPPGCEQQARDFYGGLLGLREIEKPEPLRARGGVWFESGPVSSTSGWRTPSRRRARPTPRYGCRPPRSTRWRRAWPAAGARVDWNHDLHEVRRFFTDDPWGNRVELLAGGPD